jgi:histidinol-phosphatase
MIDPMAELYDLAPLPVILAEAGGRFTSLDGEDGPGHGGGIGTNGLLHESLLATLGGAATAARPG